MATMVPVARTCFGAGASLGSFCRRADSGRVRLLHDALAASGRNERTGKRQNGRQPAIPAPAPGLVPEKGHNRRTDVSLDV